MFVTPKGQLVYPSTKLRPENHANYTSQGPTILWKRRYWMLKILFLFVIQKGLHVYPSKRLPWISFKTDREVILISCVIYFSYEPSRILVRQGQHADVYYLILSGVGISRTISNKDDPKRNTRCTFLRKGDAIGVWTFLNIIYWLNMSILIIMHRYFNAVIKLPDDQSLKNTCTQ